MRGVSRNQLMVQIADMRNGIKVIEMDFEVKESLFLILAGRNFPE